jgi:hypothetical protein
MTDGAPWLPPRALAMQPLDFLRYLAEQVAGGDYGLSATSLNGKIVLYLDEFDTDEGPRSVTGESSSTTERRVREV